MEYKDIFKPETLKKLNSKSAENLKTMLGDKNLMQTIMSSQKLLSQISAAETPYKAKLEKLAVDMIKELYPIISQEGIKLDAKIGDIGSVTGELDEITVNKPNPLSTLQSLEAKIKASTDPMEKRSLAVKCAEIVLFIWEEKYPTDKRPRKAIEAAKAYLADPTETNRNAIKSAADAAIAAADYAYATADADYADYTEAAAEAAAYAATYVYAAYATDAADAAIRAVKGYYKLK
jgi:hypothetical protein